MTNTNILNLKNVSYTMDTTSKNNDGFIGFFDWLRNNNGLITGIRLCFFEHQLYNEYLIKFPYVKPSFENKCMEILFEGNTYNADLSGDQDFINNYVYESANGEYLFTFGLDHLTEEELNSLLQYCEKITFGSQ
jgi:hypothetical protein